MIKSRKYMKYVMIVALVAIITFMVGCPTESDEPVSVTDITITGAGDAVEVGNGSTLQMTADILPTGATDASVTWSVVAGTGTATISTTGLLTATGVGTVTVKAVANDDSLIEGTLVITITAIADSTYTIAAITGVVAPVQNVVPDTTAIDTAEYTATIAWTPADSPFEALTIYTATITLTPKAGFTATGVAADFFTVAGATATNAIDSGVVTAVFPATGAAIDTVVTITDIPGVTAPVRNVTPDLLITETDQYTGTIAWTPSDSPYVAETVYTATITLTPKSGFTLTGVAADSFVVAGATTTNAINSGVVTAVFPATAADPDVAMTIFAIPGVTAPVRNVTPDMTVTETAEYTGTVTWAPSDSPYAAETVYTATITLTPKTGFTATGVAANAFTVAGATTTNPVDSSVVTAVFPATGAAPDVAITIAAIPGVVVPGRGEAPNMENVNTDQYSGTVTWAPVASTYAPLTVYTATITLTAKTGFTLTGVSADFFTVAGATTTNAINSGVVTAVFPATEKAPLTIVDLGTAADFAILAEALISTTGVTHITGDIGISPAATTFITGFGLVDATGYATSSLITGKAYAADMAAPTPAKMTLAVEDMHLAYTDAAGRTSPDHLNLGTGAIGGLELAPGLYKWDTAVVIGDNLTLNGGVDDVWIFQISGNLNLASSFAVQLTGGAVASNVFWQVSGIATLGTDSTMEGVILSSTKIVSETGSAVNGRMLAQTDVTLDATTVVAPII